MMKRKSLFLLLAILFLSLTLAAQNEPLTQTIRGTVTDRASGVPLGYVTVQLVDLSSIGGVTGDDGQFELTKVPLGRHTVKASLTGYDPTELHEILVTSAKETVLSFSMNENIRQLEEVVVRPSVNK
ncbi:MAG TPA: prevent-host-death protein, partial [Porphyromonadaceae bacterium]|nr:prevent-host-death protein [Porphyromonadaceae bacterium]